MQISGLSSAYPSYLPSVATAPRPVESASSPELARAAFAPVASSNAADTPKNASAEQEQDKDDESASSSVDEKRTAQQEQELKLDISELASRDQEVRTHEQAHAAVGGAHAGAPTYTYTRGPDGKRYATAGEVSIDVSAVADDPQATMSKMEIVMRAALAPAEPSAQDRRVAAQAQAKMTEARVDLAQLRRLESQEAEAARADEKAEESDDPSVTNDSTADRPSSAELALYSGISAPQQASGLLDLRA